MHYFGCILCVLLPFLTAAQTPNTKSHRLFATDTIYFDFGKADIRADAATALQSVLVMCTTKDSLDLYIAAHTDAIGSDASNWKLSQARAASVQKYLNTHGIHNLHIHTRVFGEKDPIADNDTEEGRQKNRRSILAFYEVIPQVRITGKVTTDSQHITTPAQVTVRSRHFQDSFMTDSSGVFEFLAPANTVIAVDIYAPGYFYKSKMLKTKPGKNIPVEIPLKPSKSGEKADIENLYFVGNKAILLKKSEPELPKVLKFMQVNPTLRIEIAGHVNEPNAPDVTTESWEYDLSVRRAKMVYDYLLENGIDKSRITYKGYGNWEMRFPHARLEKHQSQNRRVEIRVL